MTEGGGEVRPGSRMAAIDAALRMLAVRALTECEIRARLARRAYTREEIDATVADLRARAYLDDAALAYNVAVSRAKRLYGPSRVTAELRRRGLTAEVVAGIVGRVFREFNEDDLALGAAKKLYGGRRRQDFRGGRDPQAAALLRRGFSSGAVAKALRAARGADSAGEEPLGAWAEEPEDNDEPDIEADP